MLEEQRHQSVGFPALLRLAGRDALWRRWPLGRLRKKTLKFGSLGVSSLQGNCREVWSRAGHPIPTLPALALRHWWVLGLSFLI